jgi:outer membrane protein OmpA-like peptidoglycan-associated protein
VGVTNHVQRVSGQPALGTRPTADGRTHRQSVVTGRPGGLTTVGTLLALQRLAGNAAVRSLVQRDAPVGREPPADVKAPIPGGSDDEGTFCVPYRTKENALRRRLELSVTELPLLAAFGSATQALYKQYLFGGADPQEIVDPGIIQAFANDPATQRARLQFMTLITEAIRKKQDIEDGTHAVEEFLPPGLQTELEKLFAWRNPFTIPGTLAGGIGKNQQPIGAKPSPVLDDSRIVRGSIIIETDDAGNRTAVIKPVVSVDDTLDFCPGNPGPLAAQPFTKPFSKCEASQVSGDVPFHLNFKMFQQRMSLPPRSSPTPPKPIVIPSHVLFDFDSAVVTPAGEEALVLTLGDRPQRADLSQGVRVVGHTDARGSEEYNQTLSENRARAVAQVLERRFPRLTGAIAVEGHGEREPVAPNDINGQDNPEGRRLNRRVVVEMAVAP